MREILFRGKRVDDKEWCCGYFVSQNKESYIFEQPEVDKGIDLGGYLDCCQMSEVIPETVGQYTGITDKNGRKIFEGDIIKIPDDYEEFGHNAGEIYEIYFGCGGFRLKPKYSKARGYWLEDDRMVEVIGNIHDNPELLKGGEK